MIKSLSLVLATLSLIGCSSTPSINSKVRLGSAPVPDARLMERCNTKSAVIEPGPEGKSSITKLLPAWSESKAQLETCSEKHNGLRIFICKVNNLNPCPE